MRHNDRPLTFGQELLAAYQERQRADQGGVTPEQPGRTAREC